MYQIIVHRTAGLEPININSLEWEPVYKSVKAEELIWSGDQSSGICIPLSQIALIQVAKVQPATQETEQSAEQPCEPCIETIEPMHTTDS